MNKLFLFFSCLILLISCTQEAKKNTEKRSKLHFNPPYEMKLQAHADQIKYQVINDVLSFKDYTEEKSDEAEHFHYYRTYSKKQFLRVTRKGDSLFKEIKKAILEVKISKGNLDTVYYHFKSPHCDFEVLAEFCEVAEQDFTGLRFKGKIFSVFSSWDCKDSSLEKGIFFKGKKVGTWKKWNSKNELINTKDHGNLHFIDSIQNMNYCK